MRIKAQLPRVCARFGTTNNGAHGSNGAEKVDAKLITR